MKKIFNNLILVIFIFASLFGGLLLNTSFGYNQDLTHKSSHERLFFPEGFLWGSTTASYQIEGGNYNSNWWSFEQDRSRIDGGGSAEIATDHYNRYAEDIELMSQLNLNGYRFSVEWSRIEPEKGKFDFNEIEHYRQLLAKLREKDIKPIVTLWHFSVPQWFEDEGAWENPDSVGYFSEYTEFVATELKDDVELWLTMNEVSAYLSCGYAVGKWPPGESRIYMIPAVAKNLIEAHRKSYQVIHEIDTEAEVGIDHYTSNLKPSNKYNPIDNLMAYIVNYTQTHLLLDLLKEDLDFIGVHYYYGQDVGSHMISDLLRTGIEDFEKVALDTKFSPESLYEILVRLKDYDLPIYITEIGTTDNGGIPRDQFIREHAREVFYAIEDGVDIRGMFYWSLLDNFEWSGGYEYKFGLISVNSETQERQIKEDSWGYAEIAGCNCLR